MNYFLLSQRLQNWMEDTGLQYQSAIEHCVLLAEQRISREINLDAMRETVAGTLEAGTPSIILPETAVSVNWLYVDGVILGRRTLTFIRDFCPASSTGTPRYYALQDGRSLCVAPAPASEVDWEMEFEARIDGLSPTNTDTWLSANLPDLLFYACLLESGAFIKEPEDEQRYLALYKRALDSARDEVARARVDANNLAR